MGALRKTPWKTVFFIFAVIFLMNLYRFSYEVTTNSHNVESELVSPHPSIPETPLHETSQEHYKQRKGLFTFNNQFYLNGLPFTIVAGTFHYFRTLPQQWDNRFKKMKAAGLNTVFTSIAWNVHEQKRLQFTFGERYDVEYFMQLAHQNGLYVIVSTGPYIGAEVDFGGFPSWLLYNDKIKFRSILSKPYMEYVEKYFSLLLPILSKQSYNKGGPIIAFQIENEFGSFRNENGTEYLQALVSMHTKVGIDEFMFMSDGPKYLGKGSLPGLITAVNVAHETKLDLNTLKRIKKNGPLFINNFPTGKYDICGENPIAFDKNKFLENIIEVIKMNASINFNIFVGGTNFGFHSGAIDSEMTKYLGTSYGIDAPISENGDLNEVYSIIKETLLKHGLAKQELLPQLPSPNTCTEYGQVKFQKILAYNDMIPIIESSIGTRSLEGTYPMEKLNIDSGGQGYGYILYRILFKRAKVLKTGYIHDRAQVFLNGKHIALIKDPNQLRKGLVLDQELLEFGKQNTIDVLVENLGRISWSSNVPNFFSTQYKGIIGDIKLDWKPVTDIEHIPFQFDKQTMKMFLKTEDWKDLLYIEENLPAMYKGSFDVKGDPEDTYLDTTQWGKGVAFINGVNLGRYWNVLSNRKLYVPKSLIIEGKNDIIIFEEHSPQTLITFSDKR